MNRLASILLLLVSANYCTELHEVWSIPNLLSHYVHHHSTDGVSLSDFLGDHIGVVHDTPSDEHQQDHSKLPFKHNHGGVQSGDYIPAPSPNLCVSTNQTLVEPFSLSSHPCIGSGQAVWQPPRA